MYLAMPQTGVGRHTDGQWRARHSPIVLRRVAAIAAAPSHPAGVVHTRAADAHVCLRGPPVACGARLRRHLLELPGNAAPLNWLLNAGCVFFSLSVPPDLRSARRFTRRSMAGHKQSKSRMRPDGWI